MDTFYSCASLPSTVHAVKVPALTTTTCSSSPRQLESIHLRHHHHHQTSNLKYPNPSLNRNYLFSSKKNHQISASSSSTAAAASTVNPSVSVHQKAAAGYAAALIDVSQCSGSLPQVQRDMRRLSLLLRDRQIQGMLSDPTDLSGKAGLEMMKEIGKKLKFNKHSMALVKLLIGKKKKVELIGEVVDEFRRIYNQMLFSLSTPLHHEAADMMYNSN